MNLADLVLIHHRRRRGSRRRVRLADGRQDEAAEAEDEDDQADGGKDAEGAGEEFTEVGVHAG